MNQTNITMKTNEIAIGGRKRVIPNHVILLVANQNYTTLFLENGERILVATTLKKLEERFSKTDYFFRTHRSFLININYVESFTEKAFLKMKNQQNVIVSRRKQTLLKQTLGLLFQ